MAEVLGFVETFLGYPLQIVLILLALGIFLYWFIKERPKNLKVQNELVNTIMAECKEQRAELLEERENFFKIMEDDRIQNTKISTLYDKALENSTRAIQNNTEIIKNQNTHAQLTNQTLASLGDSIGRTEEKLEKIEEIQQDSRNKINESIIILQNIHGGK